MEYEVSKIGAAVDQLDWSIRLFLDFQAYVPAITLAGAAEELLGEPLQDKATFAILKVQLAKQYSLPESVVSQSHLNRVKNWLKHGQGHPHEETLSIKLETEAIQYIVRAISNLLTHDKSLSSESPRFLEWISTRKPDFMPR